MSPTICSGKKRESRTLINSNIRRNGQGTHQLNQTLSNIVNYVAKGSLNARVSTSLRIKTHAQPDKSISDNTTVASSKQRQQQFSFLSDNAVTSSTHSDTENSFDLRLANETLTNDSTSTCGSNANSTSALSSTSTEAATSHNERMTSSISSPGEESRFHRYPSINASRRDNDATVMYKTNRRDKDSTTTNKKEPKQIHSNNIRKDYYDCIDFDSDHEEFNNRDMRDGSDGCDADMDTDESLDSMTSLDTEKSAKLKRVNHPLLRDKLLAKQQQTLNGGNNKTDDNRKPLASIRNTDGLLSIAIKTIKLVKRNQLLQQRLTQLQLETSEFIQSVLANPENRHFRENIKQCKRQEVDSV